MKPSILWPPPTDEETRRAHNSLRSRIRQAITHRTPTPRASVSTMRSTQSRSSANHPLPIDIGSTISVPSLNNETIRLVTEGGETLTIDKQIQLYTQNSLLAHPLVSPALSYLGGLPPLLVIAGNGEVLRDEIVYTYVAMPHPVHRIFIIFF
jgi:acetyl esterase/lipase